ncbi:unnamed protein product [Meloidogyne enterolobii]|uniref:Uncharacterized protein n=1 Tax=Meloidogyne enterolobii TaxID=390850 RepID=A0ACB1A8J8_MELEN
MRKVILIIEERSVGSQLNKINTDFMCLYVVCAYSPLCFFYFRGPISRFMGISEKKEW